VGRLSVLLLLIAAVAGGCCQSPSPPTAAVDADPTPIVPPLPPVPAAPPGWTSLASIGGMAGDGFDGLAAEVGAEPLALHVACFGTGRLVVMISPNEAALPSTGADAVVFPCSIDGPATMRREVQAEPGSETVTITGGVIEGFGALRPSVFQISLEQAAS
jgi:hypothetical protein